MKKWVVNLVVEGRYTVEVAAPDKEAAINAAYATLEDEEADSPEWDLTTNEQLGFFVEEVK